MIKDNRMIYPPISELTEGGKHNRYELVIGVAKCARIVTDEYVEMRARAQKMIDNHETEKPLASLIEAEYRDQKAVKIAIGRIHKGEYRLTHKDPAE